MTARGHRVRSTDESAQAPLVPIPSVFSARPFTSADVSFSASLAGIPLASGANLDRLAGQMDVAFRRALDWVSMREAPGNRRDALAFFDALASHTSALLQILGLPSDPHALLAMSNEEIRLRPGLVQTNTAGNSGKFGNEALELSRSFARKAGTAKAITIQGPNGRRQPIEVNDDVPPVFSIARLLVLANDAAVRLRASPGKSGAPPDDFSKVLFNKLTWLHLDMFGALPAIDGKERGDRLGRSVEWAAAVLSLAAERIPPLLTPGYGAPEIAERFLALERKALASVANLTLTTVADRLAAGRAFVKRHMAAAPE